MTLTPEQVIKKEFTQTRARRGYDQEEVDLFLDEVVAELRRLHQENDQLRQQLAEAGIDPVNGTLSSRDSDGLGSSTDAASSALAPESTVSTSAEARLLPAGDAPERSEDASSAAGSISEDPTEEESSRVEASDESFPADQQEGDAQGAEAGSGTSSHVADGSSGSAESAAAVIAMAQRLHDEYVAQGEAEKARLIEEGQVTHDQLIAEAQVRHDEIMNSLEAARASLTEDVETLRAFETAYREQLRSLLEDKLEQLQSSPRVEPTA